MRCDLEALQRDGASPTSTSSTKMNEISNSAIPNDEDENANTANNEASKKSHFRCRGEGLPGRNTRWSALAAPSCRGKWLRLTIGQPKKCSSDAQFIFV